MQVQQTVVAALLCAYAHQEACQLRGQTRERFVELLINAQDSTDASQNHAGSKKSAAWPFSGPCVPLALMTACAGALVFG